MDWNIHFLTVSIVLFGILTWFYFIKEKLPLNRTNILKKLFLSIFIGSLINFYAIYVEISGPAETFSIINFLTGLYYCIYEYILFLTTAYVMNFMGLWKDFTENKKLYALPAIFGSLISIISIWTDWVYYVDSTGFHRGEFYSLMTFIPVVYFFLLIFKISKKNIKEEYKKYATNIILAVFIIMLGIIVNYMHLDTPLIEIFMFVAAIILCLSFENPEFYKYKRCEFYNSDAFCDVIDEFLVEGKDFHCAGIKITNYDNLRHHYGAVNMQEGIWKLGDWLIDEYKNEYIFYIDSIHCYIVFSENYINLKDEHKKVVERFKKPFGSELIDMYIRGQIFVFEDTNKFNDSSDMIDALNMTVTEDRFSVHNIIVIGNEAIGKLNERRNMQKLIQEKIKEKNIDVFFQPLYSVEKNKITGMEALVRIIDEEQGIIPPIKFIPLAEETGQIRAGTTYI